MIPRWARHLRPLSEISPIWLVPVVGLWELPIALRSLGWASASGVFVILIAGRLIAGPSLPDPTKPSLLVVVSPFAAGLTALLTLNDQLTPLRLLLFVVALRFASMGPAPIVDPIALMLVTESMLVIASMFVLTIHDVSTRRMSQLRG